MLRSLAWILPASLLCSTLPGPISGQEACDSGATLRGVAREVESGVALGFATVSLQTADNNVLVTTRTDRAGGFTLCGLRAGRYELTASLAEYTAGPTALAVTEDAARDRATLEVVLAMSAEAFALDTINVEARPRDLDPPGFAGFEERRASGFGMFVMPEEIRARNPSRVTDVLREAGVAVHNHGRQIWMRRTSCGPMVYIDGVRVTHLSRAKPVRPVSGLEAIMEDPTYEAADAANMVHPSAVRAIEVYRGPGETPGEYLDSNARCGVILIWTWRGPPPRS